MLQEVVGLRLKEEVGGDRWEAEERVHLEEEGVLYRWEEEELMHLVVVEEPRHLEEVAGVMVAFRSFREVV